MVLKCWRNCNHASPFVGDRFQTPHLQKARICEWLTTLPETMFWSCLVCFLFAQTPMGATFSLQFLEHHVIWLKDLFELSNNSDAPTHWNVMNFYSQHNPRNLQNHEVQTCITRGVHGTMLCFENHVKYIHMHPDFLNYVVLITTVT